MTRMAAHLAAALLLCLWLGATAGCSMVPSWAGGDSSTARVDTTDRYETEAVVDLGQMLVVTVQPPSGSTHELAGASFDPTMLRLDTVQPDPDETGRTVYAFTTLAQGKTLVELRIRPVSGGDKETYKVINLKIEE